MYLHRTQGLLLLVYMISQCHSTGGADHAPALLGAFHLVTAALDQGEDIVYGSILIPRATVKPFQTDAKYWWHADRASSGDDLRRALDRSDGFSLLNRVSNPLSNGSTDAWQHIIMAEERRRRDSWLHVDVLSQCADSDVVR